MSLVFAFFINPIGASAINPGTQNLGPIHPHHPSSRGAFTLTSVVSSTGPALPNWILPETPVAVAGFQRPQVNSVRDHRDGTSSSRRESSTGIDCETHCHPVPIRVRKQTSCWSIIQGPVRPNQVSREQRTHESSVCIAEESRTV